MRRDQPTVILHVGDYDASGEAISKAAMEDVQSFVTADRVIMTQEVHWDRVALTPEQIERHELPGKPVDNPKPGTREAKWEGETVQLEALPPDVLARIVDEAISEYFNATKLKSEITREASDKIDIRSLMPGEED